MLVYVMPVRLSVYCLDCLVMFEYVILNITYFYIFFMIAKFDSTSVSCDESFGLFHNQMDLPADLVKMLHLDRDE